ncbi:hypothetical protein EVAR_25982_1 [Eumeta japonica]|uniref:Uncharacterized protein n=1 Tax=Eumeta variegata TaxID=151549 RepID=A0A4C1V1G7_EUMVA|nr:hypothetical protein EVAR_25982_1 [Eumeta japonica]
MSLIARAHTAFLRSRVKIDHSLKSFSRKHRSERATPLCTTRTALHKRPGTRTIRPAVPVINSSAELRAPRLKRIWQPRRGTRPRRCPDACVTPRRRLDTSTESRKMGDRDSYFHS